MAKKCLRFHALFYKSLKISLSKKECGRVPPETLTGVVPMRHYSHSDALNVSLGAFGTLTKYLNPVIFFQFGYGHHVPCLRPMAFFHRMSHHKCNTFEFRCRT